jgi:hypothetical protein
MARDFDSNIDTTVTPEDNPESKWLAWAIWSGISLVMVLFAVLVAGFDSGLLLGWAVGIIVAAMLMVFGR